MRALLVFCVFLLITICICQLSAYTVRVKRQDISFGRQSQKTLQRCTESDGTLGSCRDLKYCEAYIEKLKNVTKDRAFILFLRQSNIICQQPRPVVCCPFKYYTLPTPSEGCGVAKMRGIGSNPKIIGGEPAQQGAYPWVALLGYVDIEGYQSLSCGGTLITSRHVLTAAHCIKMSLRFVRLGEHDLTTDAEAPHVDVDIERVTRHPRYDRRDGHSDIAMLYLVHDVQFSDTIVPICLPLQRLRTKDYTGHNPIVVGWGNTQEGGNSSDVLMQLQIQVLTNQDCSDRFSMLGRMISSKQFDNAILCAGVLTGGKDSCSGDSGGPLMLAERINNVLHFHLIGIVSYGIGCARTGVPGVYARVQNFLDWIEERIHEPI